MNVFDLKESEIDEFIDERLSFLNSKSSKDDTINIMDEPVSSFISDKQTVIVNNGGWGFKMNDKSIYKDLINAMRENPNVSPLMHVFHTVYKYFGDPKPTAEREIEQLFHSQENSPFMGEGDAVFDLEEFKNKNIAVCSQFAPMAHNLTCFIGAGSYLLYGYKIDEDGERGHKHAFNCLKGYNDTYYLLDYLMKTNNPDGSLGVFLFKQITGEEFDSFINGDIRITCECTNPPLTYETYFLKNREKHIK